MDHPCFSQPSRAGDDFQLPGGLFCLFRSGGIFSGLRDDFFAWHTTDTDHNNTPGLESSVGKYKTLNRTNDIESRAITRRASLRSCKPPEDGLDMNLIGGLPAACGSSLCKARSCRFELFLFALELNNRKAGMKRIKRIFNS